ncbi:MAG: hypothetical protein CBC25_03750 [Pelagibacteraceae bacterium TMED65]|nr:hypothetical protein [Rickettsiales bacterium]OUU52157.1 MAG: hypothetical protein CBC25_03750 [Pelagibacteraceae bacterium TMED65]|tara:strand:- start:849 stop:1061 length:213 start_codon:yes stop_codon:yes gene_type:complete
MTEDELNNIRAYLNRVFKTDGFNVISRKSIDDSCEIYLNDEFLGLIYKESDEGEDDYQFHMTILKEDLHN